MAAGTLEDSSNDRGKVESVGIERWLTGRSVLVTGVTGFVGSVLCEKLCRSCTGLTKVFCLVRERKGISAAERMKETLKQPLFKQLNAECKSKIVVIDSDITEPNLGLSEADRRTLQSEVSVVFHVAASTNFSSPLDVAVKINLCGTKYVLDFTKSCPKAQCFLYVSTSYCNSMVRGPTMEAIYPMSIKPNDLIEMVQTKVMTESDVKLMLGGHSNTYSFTKQLAEGVLRTERGHLPVAIVRPSLVLGCMNEPVPGWLSNVQNGGVAFIAGAGKGIFRVVVGHSNKVADIVPVDLVVNQCIAAAWDVVHNPPEEGISVTHCVTGTQNPVTWGQYCDMVVDAARKNPSQELAFYPVAKCRSNPLRVYIFVYLFQLLPCILIQPVEYIFLVGRPLITFQQKFIRGIHYVRFFTTRCWTFDDREARQLEKRVLPSERNLFTFDVKKIHWPTYFETCVLGVRHFYHRDSPTTLKAGRKVLPFYVGVYYTGYFIFFIVTSFILSFFAPALTSRLLAMALTAFVYWF